MKKTRKYRERIKKRILASLATVAIVTSTIAGLKLSNQTQETNLIATKRSISSASSVTVNGTTVTCDSIIQGVRDSNLPDGDYTFVVTGKTSNGTEETKSYEIELINFYDDVTYSITSNYYGDSSTDYKMLVLKYWGDLTIESGANLSTTGNTNKTGLFICVMGTLTNNGSISMSNKGAIGASGENVYLYKNSDGSFEYVPAIGGSGGASASINNSSGGRAKWKKWTKWC